MDKEIEAINAKKLKKLQDAAALETMTKEVEARDKLPRCANCHKICDEELLTELKPGAVYCPACVIQAAKAFALSKSFMIEISSNKKRTYAKISEFNTVTNQLENPQIIDVMKMPIISIVGTIDFFKAVPGVKKNGK